LLKLLYSLIVLMGTVFGVTLAFYVDPETLRDIPGFSGDFHPRVLLGIILGGLGYLVAATVSWELEKWFERQLPKLRFRDIVLGVGGLVSGLVCAGFLLIPLYSFYSADTVRTAVNSSAPLKVLSVVAPPFILILFGYLGILIFWKKQDEMGHLLDDVPPGAPLMRSKLLDTSVIIDGRVLDLIRTGIIEGPLLVPQFVLAELQYIADAPDQHKRHRGKRGFEVLEKLKEVRDIQLEFAPDTCQHLTEVDAKLVHLARERKAVLITNDMNLHKLAHLQGISSVNLHEVSNALRPVILPAEELDIAIVKKGKEARQGVGYLNDGTMIVVENGANHVGTTQRVTVASVLQTSAGRMIFARIGDPQEPIRAGSPVSPAT
jgi:uncharacterized protein YacL